MDITELKEVRIELFNGWMEDNISPCDWSNSRRWKNYFAIVLMDDNGDEEKDFLPVSKDSDLYFNVSTTKKYDILLASCWDDRKHRQYKHYYIVTDINNDTITLAYCNSNTNFTTYRKTYKALQEINKSI